MIGLRGGAVALSKQSLFLYALCFLALLGMALISPAGQALGSALNQVVMTTAGSHAANHPEADLVRSCQPDFKIFMRSTKFVDICSLQGGWGFRPWLKTGDMQDEGGVWSERTAYQKPTVNNFQDLLDYVKRNNQNPFLKPWRLFQRAGSGWVEVPVE
jgi:hypothetical protein